LGMTAGAVLSGSYFGDKVSPMSDTTNLAAAMSGIDLFSHIRYLLFTTIPTISVTLIVFIILGLNIENNGDANTYSLLESLEQSISVRPWLFIVPLLVMILIVKKTPPLIALLIGTLLGGFAALIFQTDLIVSIGGGNHL